MSTAKKLKSDNTPQKRRSGASSQNAINNNGNAPFKDEMVVSLHPPHSTNQNSVKIQGSNITSEQVFFPDTRLVQSIAESVKDGLARLTSDGLKQYGPFYLEIPEAPQFDKIENNNKTERLKEVTESQELEQNSQEMEKLLTCLGCLKRLHPPISASNNSHYICNMCTQTKHYKCPTCGERVSYYSQNLVFINNVINLITLRCKFGQSGCSFKGIPKNLIVHEKSCDYQDVHCMLFKSGEVCHDLVSLHDYLSHIQTYHKYYFRGQFKINKVNEMTLPRKVNLERNHYYFRVLKDDEKSVCFIESIYYDDASRTYQISVHFVGKKSEASEYIYTIDILKGDHFKEYRYSNDCLPAMPPMDAERFHPFILHDRNNCYSIHRCLRYNLTVTKKVVFDTFSCPQVIRPGNFAAVEK